MSETTTSTVTLVDRADRLGAVLADGALAIEPAQGRADRLADARIVVGHECVLATQHLASCEVLLLRAENAFGIEQNGRRAVAVILSQ